MKEQIEFVSYDGEYPHLCVGTLVLRIGGEVVSLENCLESGGYLDDDYCQVEGEWSVSLPKELEHLKEEITEIVNENIEHGCCGGCE